MFITGNHLKNQPQLEIGQLVRSKAGRDRGQYYLVLRTETQRVWLVDGYGRTKANPKPKNPRHLQPVGRVSEEFAQKANLGRLTPEDMRACLQALLREHSEQLEQIKQIKQIRQSEEENPDTNPSMDEEALVNV